MNTVSDSVSRWGKNVSESQLLQQTEQKIECMDSNHASFVFKQHRMQLHNFNSISQPNLLRELPYDSSMTNPWLH